MVLKALRQATRESITLLLTKSLNNEDISAVVTTNMEIMQDMRLWRTVELMPNISLS